MQCLWRKPIPLSAQGRHGARGLVQGNRTAGSLGGRALSCLLPWKRQAAPASSKGRGSPVLAAAVGAIRQLCPSTRCARGPRGQASRDSRAVPPPGLPLPRLQNPHRPPPHGAEPRAEHFSPFLPSLRLCSQHGDAEILARPPVL